VPVVDFSLILLQTGVYFSILSIMSSLPLRVLPPPASRRDGRETKNPAKLSSLGGGVTVGDGGGLKATERSPLRNSPFTINN